MMKFANRCAVRCIAVLGCAAILGAAGAPAHAQDGTQPAATASAGDLHDRQHDTSTPVAVVAPAAPAAPARPLPTAPAKPAPKPTAASPAEVVPAAATQPLTRTVTGMICIDANSNGQCDAGEQPIRDVIVRAQSGAFTLSSALGQFSIDTPVNDMLEIPLPGEYRSLSGQRAITVPLSAGMTVEPISLALLPAMAAPVPTTAGSIVPPIKIELPRDFARPIVNLNVDLQPLYIAIAGLAGVLLLSQLLISSALRAMRRSHDRSFKSQEVMLADQRKQELLMQLQAPIGWCRLAEQLAADALTEPVSIDEDAGILDASSQPAPKFTLASRDGTEFIFTIDPALLKKQRLVDKHDKVVKLSQVSSTSKMDVSMLWEYVMASRRLWRVTPPRHAEWYLIVRAGRAPAGLQIAAPKPKQLAARR
jgi:hypothetical protein